MMSWRVILILAVILSSVLVTLGWCIILIIPVILGWALILSWLLDGAMWGATSVEVSCDMIMPAPPPLD
jgi:hypothetical protein